MSRQKQVLQHPLLGHYMAQVRVHLVPVDAAQTDGRAVDQQAAVFDFQGAETHFLLYLLDYLTD